MIPSERGLSQWQVAGHPFLLECTVEAIEQLRQSTRTAELFPPDRTTLWGKREGMTLHVRGISQATSGAEEEYVPVGWFQVRLATEILLSDEDLRYSAEHFPEPGAVVLILRPTTGGAVRVGVFFRESNGSFRAASSYQEVLIPGPVEAKVTAITRAPASLEKAAATATRATRNGRIKEQRAAETKGNDHPVRENRPQPDAPASKRGWAAMGLAFVTGAVAGTLSFAAIRAEEQHPALMLPASALVAVPARPETAPAPSQPSAADPSLLQKTRELTEQAHELQTALEAEKVHTRRLEAMLSLMRERSQNKATPRVNSFENEARAQPIPLSF